jgi:hypothetical protein
MGIDPQNAAQFMVNECFALIAPIERAIFHWFTLEARPGILLFWVNGLSHP